MWSTLAATRLSAAQATTLVRDSVHGGGGGGGGDNDGADFDYDDDADDDAELTRQAIAYFERRRDAATVRAAYATMRRRVVAALAVEDLNT